MITSEYLEDTASDTCNNNWTPCEEVGSDGFYHCPYSEDPTPDMCRCYCSQGVDE